MQHNPALNLAPFGRWTLRDKAAQRRLALRYTLRLLTASPPSAPVLLQPFPELRMPFLHVARCSPCRVLLALLAYPKYLAFGAQKTNQAPLRYSLPAPPSVIPLYYLACHVLSYNCAVNADTFKLRFRRPLRRR